jgi:hypothetical protein
MTQVVVDGKSLLLVAYDTEYPEPIYSKRPVPDAFGLALVLTPDRRRHSVARIDVALGDERPDTMADSMLETLRLSIPAARSLPLLSHLARADAGRTVLEYLGGAGIVVNVAPCV